MSTALSSYQQVNSDHRRPPTVTYNEEVITPEMARIYLDGNTHNRKLRPRAIKAYAEDMKAGRWQINGEGIKITRTNKVADGQNRLHAVIMAGVPVRMLVVRGVEDEAQETMDSGVSRKLLDALNLRGEIRTASLAAVIRALYVWDNWPTKTNRRLVGSDVGANPVLTSTSILLNYFGEHAEEIRRLTVLCDRYRRTTSIPSSIMAPVFREMERRDPVDASDFFDRLHKGLPSEVNFGQNDPIVVLHRGVTRLLSASNGGRRGRYSSTEMAAYIAKAWNAYRKGVPLGLLRYRSGGSAPEPFPEFI